MEEKLEEQSLTEQLSQSSTQSSSQSSDIQKTFFTISRAKVKFTLFVKNGRKSRKEVRSE